MDNLDYAGLLPYLAHFLEIARTESLSKASVSLHLTQSAMSKSLDKLEKAVGMPLFERKRGSVRLNSDGYILYSNLQQAMDIIEGAFDQIMENKRIRSQQVTFCSSTQEFTADLLNAYMEDFPDVVINQSYAPPNQLVSQLQEEVIDFAISTVSFPVDLVSSQLLYEDEIVFLTSTNGSLQGVVSLEQLAPMKWVCCSAFLDSFQLLQRCSLLSCTPTLAQEAWSLDFILNQVKSGGCVLPIPLHTAQGIISVTPQLRILRVKGTPLTQQTILAVNDRKKLSANALAFIDCCKDYFAQLRKG